MLKLFDPTLEPEPEPQQSDINLIPLHQYPKMQIAKLPGQLKKLPLSHVCLLQFNSICCDL